MVICSIHQSGSPNTKILNRPTPKQVKEMSFFFSRICFRTLEKKYKSHPKGVLVRPKQHQQTQLPPGCSKRSSVDTICDALHQWRRGRHLTKPGSEQKMFRVSLGYGLWFLSPGKLFFMWFLLVVFYHVLCVGLLGKKMPNHPCPGKARITSLFEGCLLFHGPNETLQRLKAHLNAKRK